MRVFTVLELKFTYLEFTLYLLSVIRLVFEGKIEGGIREAREEKARKGLLLRRQAAEGHSTNRSLLGEGKSESQ